MGKAKKNRNTADALLVKKSRKNEKKVNPFEISVSKPKYAVLDRDPTSLRGAPGVSRSKAMMKRKETLGKEYLSKDKANRFKDHRKDERNMGRDALEEAQRRAEQKSMNSRKKEMFNLNDTVMLTHKGQTLEEIERFDDGVDGESSDDDGGRLDAEFTEAAHFGGGEDDKRQDRKTVIEEMIAESKRRKVEKQKDNDEIFEMTEKLDKGWSEVIPLVGKLARKDQEKPPQDDYDRTMREMIFERRGAPAERLKSEKELAKIEKEKLEKMERERQARMKGDDGQKKIKHKSADDLDDGYLLQSIDESEGQATAYDEDPDAGDGYSVRNFDQEKQQEEKEAEEIEEEEDEENEEEGEEDEEEKANEESGDESEDSLNDLKEDSESESENDEPKTNGKNEAEVEENGVEQEDENKMEIMKKAAKELPYTFELPNTYEELEKLLANHPPELQATIVDRMLKSNNPRFVKDSKKKMVSLFVFLIQHLNDTFSDLNEHNIESSFKVLDKFPKFLFDLSQLNPQETTKCFIEVIKEKFEDYNKKVKLYPDLDTLIYLKLVPLLFSSSDYRHSVVTPTLVFIGKILSRAQVRSRKDVVKGLFLVTTLMECAQISKRFLPAALNFLNGIIFMFVQKRPVLTLKIVPPFKSTSSLLVLEAPQNESNEKEFRLKATDFVAADLDDDFKVRVLNTSILMIQNILKNNVDENVGIPYIASNFLENLEKIDFENFPNPIQKNLEKTLEILTGATAKKMYYLVQAQRKPKPLRLIEPKIENIYEDIRRRPKTALSIKQNRDRLVKKVKKETKSAVREIRKDNQFISKMQFRQKVSSDHVRKEKVKRIFSEASTQQGEYNAMDRKQKFKK